MVMSRREKFVGYATGAVLGVVVLNWMVVEPLLAEKAELARKIADAEQKVGRNRAVIEKSHFLSTRWAKLGGTKLSHKASDAESQFLSSIREWAQDAGLALGTIKPERSEKEKGFERVTIRAQGAGTKEQLAWFLFQVHASRTPVRVIDITVTAKKDNTDDLSVTMGLATIYSAAPAEGGGGGGGTGGGGTAFGAGRATLAYREGLR